MFLFKFLGRRHYQQLLDAPRHLRQQCRQVEMNAKLLEKEKEDLQGEYRRERSDLDARVKKLRHQTQDYESLRTRFEKLKDDVETEIAEGISTEFKKLGFSPEQVETFREDREDLIELHLTKLYSLAKRFALSNKEAKTNRGIFLLLVDERNMVSENFSEFHGGQTEYLTQEKFKDIDGLPHIFSSNIDEVLDYMGERVAIKNENGEITGYEERDGALLINLQGIAFRSCVMVEGVRTHRVYEKVEALQKGSAKHNAGIYASSLDEVLAAIIVSEENSEVVLFREGRFVKSYNPFSDTEMLSQEQLTQTQLHEEIGSAQVGEIPEIGAVEDEEVKREDSRIAASPTG
ncbi:MAG: hypothetical protein OXN17_01760 [Candidatus Poribacteria bacterium]|nr:hypothetical protein [Candidatus Poribacteria bacterium]MDE0502937.1 hypothetical protein [Candidatus Poribacteria bacterium]